jgi:NAD(P)-dependent dehydrogenase (short-subunit alcohol dehydrogenase family)
MRQPDSRLGHRLRHIRVEKADVGNATEVEHLFGETVKVFGSIDVVVNNSGIMPLSPIGKGDAAVRQSDSDRHGQPYGGLPPARAFVVIRLFFQP